MENLGKDECFMKKGKKKSRFSKRMERQHKNRREANKKAAQTADPFVYRRRSGNE